LVTHLGCTCCVLPTLNTAVRVEFMARATGTLTGGT
jgi:hypothetical protein